MRPALLRLLKRPSALSVIDSLVTSSTGIENLHNELRRKCLRCLSSAPQLADLEVPESRPPNEHNRSKPTRRSLSFPVHSLLPPDGTANDEQHTKTQDVGYTRRAKLALDPERLEIESDVGHTQDVGPRLVDDPAHRNDFELWLELLRYRQRHYGDNGTFHIWEGLMDRSGRLQLPVHGESADALWQSFVDLGLRNEAVLAQVADYASRLWAETGRRWPRLYQSIVGSFIKRGMADHALKWHKRLQNPHLSDSSDIADCLAAAVSDYDATKRAPGGFRARISAFREICKHTHGHKTYGRVMSALLASGKTKELLRMHKFLTERGDHPKGLDELQPLLEYTKSFSSLATRERIWRYSTERFPSTGQVDSGAPSLAKDTQELNVRDGFKAQEFKDDFGARIFATRALTVDMVIAGLKTFSVRSIGPQSLREMAKRAHGCRDVLEKLVLLEKNKISIGNSLFARLLRKFAEENRETLLDDLIHSDQHHEVLEDLQTQASFMVSSYASHDMRQYQFSLVILKELVGEGEYMNNLHVQKHIAAEETNLAINTVADMLVKGHAPDPETHKFMVNYLFGPRKPGRRAVQQANLRAPHNLAFAWKYLRKTSLMGGRIPLKIWIEMLKQFGMGAHWHSLYECCMWLARRYSNVHTHPAGAAQGADTGILTLEKLFGRHMQEAIVSWGFLIDPPSRLRSRREYALGRNNEQLVPFARGILLLRELQRHGVKVEVATVRRVCRQRLVMLYGPSISSNKPRNRALRRHNPYTVDHVIADLNSAWGNPVLLDDDQRRHLRWLLQFHRPKHILRRRWRMDQMRSDPMWKEVT
ncbi:uncharacterized protein BDV14DRAFT_5531 [Aspergillus stella-maris]|uniref:uncharacterized protein n=1 Tax=Aspergillus stella-maris TaxID=1810926 RepID=UPI003CCE5359